MTALEGDPRVVTIDTDEAPAAVARSGRHRLRRIPGSIWALTALWIALLLGASVVWPVLDGFDEPQHVDLAYVYSAHPLHFYAPGTLSMTRASLGMQSYQHSYPPSRPLEDIRLPSRPQRKSMAQLGGPNPSGYWQPNQMVQHPPLYYWIEAAVLRIPGVSHLSWDLAVWLMRLASVLMLAPLPILAWATTRRLLGRLPRERPMEPVTVERAALLAAVIPLTLPNLVRDGSAVTNDALLILSVSVLLYLLSRVLTGDLSRRTAVWVAVTVAVALLSKGFALAMPPLIVLAYLIAGWRAGSDLRDRLNAVIVPGLVAVAGCVAGGLWWLRNLVDYGTVQPDGYGKASSLVFARAYGTPDYKGHLGPFVKKFVPQFVERIWGGIGLIDRPSLGDFVTYGWFFLVVAGVLAALIFSRTRILRVNVAVLLVAPVVFAATSADGSFTTFHKWSHIVAGAQGRYEYQTVALVAAVAAVGACRSLPSRVVAMATPFVLVAGLATQAAAWYLMLHSWYAPSRGRGWWAALDQMVHALIRWAPVPEAVTLILVGVVPAVTGLVAVVVVVRSGLGRSGRLPERDSSRALPVGAG